MVDAVVDDIAEFVMDLKKLDPKKGDAYFSSR